jgi:hypothetical protein
MAYKYMLMLMNIRPEAVLYCTEISLSLPSKFVSMKTWLETDDAHAGVRWMALQLLTHSEST